MKKFNWYDLGETYEAVTIEDERAIKECIESEIEMTIDELNRVYDESGTYIADVKER